MRPIINHRQAVTVSPVDSSKVEKGDVVIAKVHGRIFCHLISAVDGDRIQISNNHGFVNGWTTREHVFGIVTHVEGIPRPRIAGKTP